jgi:DNA-binding protein HU-beta
MEKDVALAIHISPWLGPGPGKCTAEAGNCPFGGLTAHLATEYLDPSVHEALKNGKQNAATMHNIRDAMGAMMATEGNRLMVTQTTRSLVHDLVFNYNKNSLTARQIERTMNTFSEIKDFAQQREGRLRRGTIVKGLKKSQGTKASRVMYEDIMTNEAYKDEADRRKKIIGVETYREDQESNLHPINKRKQNILAAEEERKAAMREQLIKEEKIPESEIPVALLPMGKTEGQRKWAAVEHSQFLPDREFKSSYTKRGKTVEGSVTVNELAAKQARVDQAERNRQKAEENIALLMAVSSNEDIRSGKALGKEITHTVDGRVVTAKIKQDVPIEEEIRKLPPELQSAIQVTNKPTLDNVAFATAMAQGLITPQEYEALTKVEPEVIIFSLDDMEKAAKENPIHITHASALGDLNPNDPKDTTQAIVTTLEDFGRSENRYLEQHGYAPDTEKEHLNTDKQIFRNAVGDKYGSPDINVMFGGEGEKEGTIAAGSTVVQAVNRVPVSIEQQKKILGPKYDELVQKLGVQTASFSAAKMKKKLPPEMLSKCLGAEVTVTSKKAPAKKKKAPAKKAAGTAKKPTAKSTASKASTTAKKATSTSTAKKTTAAKAPAAKSTTARKTTAAKSSTATTAKADAPKKTASASAKSTATRKSAAAKSTASKAASTATKKPATKAPAAKAASKAAAPKAEAPKTAPATPATPAAAAEAPAADA